MVKLEIICLLIAVGLTAIATVVQVNCSSLTLPIALGTTILTIALPVIALANFFYGPALYRLSQQQAGAFSLLRQFGPPGLQILQGVLAVVLITLSFQGFLPGERLDCSLENNWKRLWMTHDGRAIERIQDAFNCCGFKTIKDRAWPPQIGQCSQLYGRQSACVGSWRASMQRNSGLEFAVAVTVGILQLVQLVMFRLGQSGRGSARRYRQITQNESAGQAEGRLLDDSDGIEENDDTNGPRGDYGAIEERSNSPRVEPSHLGEDRNHWVS